MTNSRRRRPSVSLLSQLTKVRRAPQPAAGLHIALRGCAGTAEQHCGLFSPGDGPPSEFYYDGKTVMAYSPDTNLMAVAQAPPTIDEMMKAAFDVAAIYFPFTDLIVADPYRDLSEAD